MKPEELLAHNDFIRALARKLVGDEHLAADISQQTCAAALEASPDTDRPLKPWLAQVARNFARQLFRKESRRREKEALAAGERYSRPTDEIVAQEAIRRKVVEAVLDLDDPFRTALLLRYYDDLPPREIAERLEIPVNTVRTHLQRGLVQLKKKLDAMHGGARDAWLTALVPVALSGSMAASSGNTGWAATSASKTIVLGGALKMAAALLILLTSVVVIWQFLPEEPGEGGAGAVPADQAAVFQEDRMSLDSEVDAGALSQEPQDTSDASFSESRNNPQDREILAPMTVTWRGIVYDFDGMPLRDRVVDSDGKPHQEGRIELRTRQDKSRMISEKIDHQGRFVLSDLPLGSYALRISTPNQDHRLDLGGIELKTQGFLEQDIHLADAHGAWAKGLVIDEASNAPIRGKKMTVAIVDDYLDGGMPFTVVDPGKGTFHFGGLKPGIYDIHLMGPGIHMDFQPQGLKIIEGQKEADVVFKVPALGELKLTLEGFDKHQLREMKIRFLTEEIRARNYGIYAFLGEKPVSVPLGRMTVEVKHGDLGKISQDFHIVQGKVEEWVILPGDFRMIAEESGRPVTVRGRLTRGDGTAVAHAGLMFRPVGEVRALNTAPQITTDSKGEFIVREIESGQWTVICLLEDPGRLPDPGAELSYDGLPKNIPVTTLYGVEIPKDPPDSFLLELTLPSGNVKGTLYDGRTGMPLEDEDLHWDAVLLMKNMNPSSALKNGTGSRLELFHLPEGEYLVTVIAQGYRQYLSELLSLSEGQTLDLGRIDLVPTGIIDLEVVTPRGESTRRFSARCQGKDLGRTTGDSVRLPGNRMRYWMLPTGPVQIEVRPHGYKTKTVDLVLEPAKPLPVKVMLETEEEE
ncbi:MAG: RNA polymerase sigma factor [Planctomycetota bacterium]|jgi:RNA polymerase sigma-70 factor (ECF subfamily)